MVKLKKYKLGELIDVRRGASLAGEYYSTEGELMRLTLGHFDYQCGGFKDNTSKDDLYFTGAVKPEFILNKGDIITPLTEQTPGLLGSTAMIPESEKYIQSQDVALITPDESKLGRNYCYYLLPSKIVKQQLAAGAQQTKIRHTTPARIKDLTVFIPDLPNQKAIGQLLRDIDRKIALNREINRNLEAMARQLYDYWFVQFDFPDENSKPYKSSGGKMVRNEKLKRDIPKGWKECTLHRYIGRITNGLNPRQNFVLGTGSNFYVSIRSLEGRDINWESCEKCDDSALAKINSRSQLQCGDVIFSAIGTIGRTYYIQEDPNNWNISETSFAIRPSKEIPSSFFYELLISPEIQMQADKNAMGSTMRCLVMDALCKIPTMDIPTNVVNKFNNIIAPIHNALYERNKEKRNLYKLREELLPLLMNGQVSVMPKEVNCDLSDLGR